MLLRTLTQHAFFFRRRQVTSRAQCVEAHVWHQSVASAVVCQMGAWCCEHISGTASLNGPLSAWGSQKRPHEFQASHIITICIAPPFLSCLLLLLSLFLFISHSFFLLLDGQWIVGVVTLLNGLSLEWCLECIQVGLMVLCCCLTFVTIYTMCAWMKVWTIWVVPSSKAIP